MIDEKFEPKSDFEAYMKNAILKKGVVGLPIPQSRMEMLLYELVAILESQGVSGGGSVTSVAWNAITGKPTVFPPATHDHNKLYSLLDHNHDNMYSPLTHNHDATYSMAGHNHDVEYYKKTAIDKMFESFNPGTGTPVIPSWDTITGKPETFPPASHTHNEYAQSTHTHSGYAAMTHNHDTTYSKTNHSHTEFAANNHNHDNAYAAKSHTHTNIDATTVTGKKVWTGNQQAYDSIGVKDANTLYFITEG